MFVSVFMDNYGSGVKEAVKMCNEAFLRTYIPDVDCESVFFDVDDCRQKSINAKGQELVDFWDAYKEYYEECKDMWKLPIIAISRKVMEIRDNLLFPVNEKVG